MRNYLAAVAGNDALRERLGRDLEQNALSHAYILEGPRGIGKQTLALELAMALACEHRNDAAHPLPCHSCPSCRKIAAGNSPDVIHVYREEDKATMGVDVVRMLRSDVITVPNDLNFKIYIVHDAHTMTIQAQNAFLLTLEEPPAFVLFFLLCEDAGMMLETIRSRAPVLRMRPVDDERIKAHLLTHAPSPELSRAASDLHARAPEDFAAVLRIAGGCIGTVIDLLDEEKRAPLLKNRKIATDICRLLADRGQPDVLLTTLLSLGKKRDEVTSKLGLLQLALRDLLLLHYSDNAEPIFFTDKEAALELCTRFTARELLSTTESVEKAIKALAASGNVRLTLVQLMIELT